MRGQQHAFAVHGLTVRYSDGAGGISALDHVDAVFPAEGVTAIVGESGSGKSTLGQALFGALPPGAAVEGQVLFGAADVTALGQEELRRRYWGKSRPKRRSMRPTTISAACTKSTLNVGSALLMG